MLPFDVLPTPCSCKSCKVPASSSRADCRLMGAKLRASTLPRLSLPATRSTKRHALLVFQLAVIGTDCPALKRKTSLKGHPCSCDHLGFCPHRFQSQTGRTRRFDTESKTTTPQHSVFQGRGSHRPLGTRERYHPQCLASQVCKEDRHRLPENSTCITPKMPCVHHEQRGNLTQLRPSR